jgi:hypothetical protein
VISHPVIESFDPPVVEVFEFSSTTVPFTVKGKGFLSGAKVSFDTSKIEVSGPVTVTDTAISGEMTVSFEAKGGHFVTVHNPDEGVAQRQNAFSVSVTEVPG